MTDSPDSPDNDAELFRQLRQFVDYADDQAVPGSGRSASRPAHTARVLAAAAAVVVLAFVGAATFGNRGQQVTTGSTQFADQPALDNAGNDSVGDASTAVPTPAADVGEATQTSQNSVPAPTVVSGTDDVATPLSEQQEPDESDAGGPATSELTAEPTAVPTAEPTAVPTAEPTAVPTAEPTAVPTSLAETVRSVVVNLLIPADLTTGLLSVRTDDGVSLDPIYLATDGWQATVIDVPANASIIVGGDTYTPIPGDPTCGYTADAVTVPVDVDTADVLFDGQCDQALEVGVRTVTITLETSEEDAPAATRWGGLQIQVTQSTTGNPVTSISLADGVRLYDFEIETGVGFTLDFSDLPDDACRPEFPSLSSFGGDILDIALDVEYVCPDRIVVLAIDAPPLIAGEYVSVTAEDGLTEYLPIQLEEGPRFYEVAVPAQEGIMTLSSAYRPLPDDPNCEYSIESVTVSANETSAEIPVADDCPAGNTEARTVTVELVADGAAAPALAMFDGQIMAIYGGDSFEIEVPSVDLQTGVTTYSFEIAAGQPFTLSVGWQTVDDPFCFYDHYETYGGDVTQVTATLEYGCTG